MYTLNSDQNTSGKNHMIDRTALSAFALSELNQVIGNKQRETRSGNPVDRIFHSFDEVFPPAVWTDNIIQVYLKLSSF